MLATSTHDTKRSEDVRARLHLLSEIPQHWGEAVRRCRAVNGAAPEAIWARLDEGVPKLWVIRQALSLRRRRPMLFGPQGDYQPLAAWGPRANQVVAFVRGGGVVTVVPRLVLRLNGDWGETTLALPPGRWRNEFTGEELWGGMVPLAVLLARFPVALLAREEEAA